MREKLVGLPTGLGGITYLQAHVEAVKARFERVRIGFAPETLKCRPPEYLPVLARFAELVFKGSPYSVEPELRCPLTTPVDIINEFGITPRRPRLAKELCKGQSLGLKRPYLALHTKSRLLPRDEYKALCKEFFALLRETCRRYRLVLIGEREVEYNTEYRELGENSVYSWYDDAIRELPVIDKTFPRLGVSPPQLGRLREDCLIMHEARSSVHLGLGGGLCLGTAVGEMLCYRSPMPFWIDGIFTPGRYPKTVVTTSWSEFRDSLRCFARE